MERLPTELISLILGPANNYRCEDHDNARLVCKAWRNAIPRRMSPLMLVAKDHGAQINWMNLVFSPFMTIENIFTFGGPLLDALVRTGRMPLAMVAAHLYLPHDWTKMSRRTDLTSAFIIAHADRAWDYKFLSNTYWHKAFEPELIHKLADKDWDWAAISAWRNDAVNALVNTLPHKSWSYDALSFNPNVHDDTVLALPEKPWNLLAFAEKREISTGMAIFLDQRGIDRWDKVKDLDFALILAHSTVISDNGFESISFPLYKISTAVVAELAHKPWDWTLISRNENLDMKVVKTKPHLPWVWDSISRRPDLDMAIVSAHPDKAWNWQRISAHRRLTIDIVATNPGKPWDWRALALNAAIPFEPMMRHQDLPWDF